jgi:hypothetical protein
LVLSHTLTALLGKQRLERANLVRVRFRVRVRVRARVRARVWVWG